MHVNYCLDALRQDIICHADDTPRYTTQDSTLISGLGQGRKCRDWKKLQAWASERIACQEEENRFRGVEGFDICPSGSEYEYSSEAKEYFGLEESSAQSMHVRNHDLL